MRWLSLALLLVASEAAAADSFVVISRKADLYLAPDAAARTIHPDGSLPDHSRWRFVAEHGDFVEVESVPETSNSTVFEGRNDGYCVSGENYLEHYRLRVFVRKQDVVPVFVKPWSKRYPDGTMQRFLPGAPVTADERRLAIPAASIGTRSPATPARDIKGRYANDIDARIGGEQFIWLRAIVTHVKPLARGALVTVASACGETVIKVNDASKLKYDEEGGEGFGMPGYDGPSLPSGTALFIDQIRVGSLRRNLTLQELRAKRDADGRYCWDVPFKPAFHLCADGAAKPQAARPLGAISPPPPPSRPRDPPGVVETE